MSKDVYVCALVSVLVVCEHVCVCVQNNAHSSEMSGLDLSKRVAGGGGTAGRESIRIMYYNNNNNSHLSAETATTQQL